MKKKLILLIDVIFILITVIPAVMLLGSCIHDAMFGVIPRGFQYGLDYGEKVYGMEAFINTFAFYCVFLFPVVILWIGSLITTIAFTVFTVIYVKSKPVSLDGLINVER